MVVATVIEYVLGFETRDSRATRTTSMAYELEGLSCAYDALAPVLPDVYQSPYAFTGTIHSVTIDVSGDLIEDDGATLKMIMAQQ